MAVSVPKTDAEIESGAPWMSAGWMKTHLNVNTGELLRLVSFGKVRVIANNGSYARYSSADMRKYLKEKEQRGEINRPTSRETMPFPRPKPRKPSIPIAK